jgi:hypothetical protein
MVRPSSWFKNKGWITFNHWCNSTFLFF